nr:GntR family transcriptional regulator [Nocardioides thalensis]
MKHVTIREYVRNLALASAPGAPAPSERELVDRFGVARMTVRQALDALVVEGVLERFPGRGTFVARPRRVPTGISSFTEDMQRRAVVAESRTLIADRVGAANGVARALGIGVRQPVLHWRRLRLADGRPVCLSDAFLNDTLVPNLFDGELPASLYDELASRGRRPTWAEDSVSAGTATAEESELLEIDASSVVIRHNRRALWEDIPIEVTRSVYPADQHTLWLQFGD